MKQFGFAYPATLRRQRRSVLVRFPDLPEALTEGRDEREAGITRSQLAARLGCDEKEVRRLLDPRHPSKLPRIEQALAQLGKRLVVEMRAA